MSGSRDTGARAPASRTPNANDGGDTYPGWYFNLRSEPDARVEVKGRIIPVRAAELSGEEDAAWWPRIVEHDPHHARYRRATSRPFPFLRLVARP